MPKNIAQKLLTQIWGNRGEPVNPMTMCDEIGIRIIVTDLRDDVEAGLYKRDNEAPHLALNESLSLDRQRQVCAVALGHYVRAVQRKDNAYEFVQIVEKINKVPQITTSLDDAFARKFAQALLAEQVLMQSKLK